MISFMISRLSIGALLVGGFALLFGADTILPRLAPGVPSSAGWLGQLVAAAWIGVAVMNWMQRTSVLGGIYGRPVVSANLVLYFVSTLSLVRARMHDVIPAMAWVVIVPLALLAAAYGALLLRGPFDRLGPVVPPR